GRKYIGTLWKNGTAHNLTDGTYEVRAYSVSVSGGDVYIVGYVDNSTTRVATLWKNGVAQDLSDGTNTTYARSVFVSGSDVYVSGYEYNGTKYVAKLWKNGVAQNLTSGIVDVQTYSVYVSGSDVYVAGHDGHHAAIWKNGTPTYLSTNDPGLPYGEALSVFVTRTLK